MKVLDLGQTVLAEVVEEISPLIYIMAFSGDLLRIKNSTGQMLKPGQKVWLKVETLKPLSFKLYSLNERETNAPTALRSYSHKI